MEFRTTKRLPYSPEQLYSIVSDIGSYPSFLPWVVKTRIVEENSEKSEVVADMFADFKGFTEQFRSLVTLHKPGQPPGETEWAVYVDLIEGPMKHMENYWRFHLYSDSETDVEFYIHFEFKSWALNKLATLYLDKATHKMVTAFEARAKEKFG